MTRLAGYTRTWRHDTLRQYMLLLLNYLNILVFWYFVNFFKIMFAFLIPSVVCCI